MKHERAWLVEIDLDALAKRSRMSDAREANRWMVKSLKPKPGDEPEMRDPSALSSPFWRTDKWGRYYATIDPTLVFDEDDKGIIRECHEVQPIDVVYGEIIPTDELSPLKREAA